jgi:hypothetical protein
MKNTKTTKNQKQEMWQRFFKENTQGDNIIFKLYVDGKLFEGSEMSYPLNKVINPDYSLFSLVSEISRLYLDCYGGSSALASQHSHWQNNLHIMAAICDCSNPKDLERWRVDYNKKHENDFKLN